MKARKIPCHFAPGTVRYLHKRMSMEKTITEKEIVKVTQVRVSMAYFYLLCIMRKRECTFAFINEQRSLFITGQVDYTEFAESAKYGKNHNFLSFLIKQPKNYP